MRLLITGSRTWDNEAAIRAVLDPFTFGPFDTLPVLVHGAATGADTIAAEYWKSLGLPDEPHAPNYRRYAKKQAPLIRNVQMVQLGADRCIAFILNGSRGATHCSDLAKKAGIPTTIYRETRCRSTVSELSKSKPDSTTLLRMHTKPPTSLNGPELPFK